MPEKSIYEDIAARTGGDIYIGVVGPVRSGKSTFIKRFMETMVLPNMPQGYDRDKARDELPQAGTGKTVMTTEPKFVPDEAANLTLDGTAGLRVRLIDCVGYLIPQAMGTVENERPRMVHTPWQEEPMPFEEAAEIGTRKVICEHATIGMLVTTDGSVGELSRENYIEAEERIVGELKAIGKPFAVVLNCANPSAASSVALAYELEEKYGVPVASVSCVDLDAEDIRHILGLVLEEFPVTEVRVSLPGWTAALEEEHPIRVALQNAIRSCAGEVNRIGDVKSAFAALSNCDYVKKAEVQSVQLGTGEAWVETLLQDGLYYTVISEMTGLSIESDEQLMDTMKELAQTKKDYDRVRAALGDAEKKGYGIVMPDRAELHLEEPELIKQAGAFGVRLRATARSLHMIRANIETEISPIVGSEQQSQDLIAYMRKASKEDPAGVWDTNLFGKSLYEMVEDGLHGKMANMPEESRARLSETLERIINEGSNGLVCILL